jgi:hypothetical protein
MIEEFAKHDIVDNTNIKYYRLEDGSDVTIDDIVNETGCSRSMAYRRVAISRLPEKVFKLVRAYKSAKKEEVLWKRDMTFDKLLFGAWGQNAR